MPSLSLDPLMPNGKEDKLDRVHLQIVKAENECHHQTAYHSEFWKILRRTWNIGVTKLSLVIHQFAEFLFPVAIVRVPAEANLGQGCHSFVAHGGMLSGYPKLVLITLALHPLMRTKRRQVRSCTFAEAENDVTTKLPTSAKLGLGGNELGTRQ